MADIVRDNPDLSPFVLPNVRLTGIRIGAGAYGSVEEVVIPGAICAAKKIHEIFLDCFEIPADEIRRSISQFVRECQLMSTLRHPNIVQFMGIFFFPGTQLPALVMERLLTSLHNLLDPELDPPPPPDTKTVLPAQSKMLHTTQRSGRPSLPPRAFASHHPPQLIRQKRSPELRYGSQDCRFGRGSYGAS